MPRETVGRRFRRSSETLAVRPRCTAQVPARPSSGIECSGCKGITDALTGDKHFEQAGFIALLK